MKLFERLLLETTGRCNRTCFFCPRQSTRSTRYATPGQMPTEEVERLLKEAAALGFKGSVSFFWLCEPLLDTRIVHFCKLARALGFRCRVNTNGDVLRAQSKRGNLHLAKQLNDTCTWISVANYDLTDPAKVAEESAHWRTIFSKPIFLMQHLGGIRDRANCDPGQLAQTRVTLNKPCLWPAKLLGIGYDGYQGFCCSDTYGDFNMPNVFGVPLKEVWENPLRWEHAAMLAKGRRDLYKLCSECPMPGTVPPVGRCDAPPDIPWEHLVRLGTRHRP